MLAVDMIKILKGMIQEKLEKKLGRKGVELEMLAWWLMAIAVAVIMVVGYFILKKKNFAAMDFIKNLFRFRSG